MCRWLKSIAHAEVERRERGDAFEAVLVVAARADVLDAGDVGHADEGVDARCCKSSVV
jgi:hypothetical protein